jgi:PKD repeat protein
MLSIAVLVCLLFAMGSALAAEECTIAVVSGSLTTDGRPLLWKNRDTDYLDQEVRYFDDGYHGGYITVVSTGIDETSTAYIGVNDEGFSIMNANAPDLNTGSPTSHGILMKLALQECGSVADFEALLNATADNRGHIWSNFGVIDRLGGAAIFETDDLDHVRYDADLEGGFVLRTNFSYWGGGGPDSRYDRAYELISSAVDSGQLDHRYIVQTVAKDIGGPPSLPCGEWPTTDPAISKSRTQAAAVVHGVLPGEDPRLSTFWCSLGEPSCGVFVPLWSCAGTPPSEMSVPGQTAPMCAEIHVKELYCYSNLTGDTTIDTNALVGDDGLGGIQGYSLPLEIEAFDETAVKLADWRLVFPSAAEIAQFQTERTGRTFFYYDNEIAPGDEGPIAAFSGSPTSGDIPLIVTFTDESIFAESWQWDFGDGGTSTLQNPTYSFDAAGSYTVSLTVGNAHGSDTHTELDYILATDPASSSEAYALADLPVAGTMTGFYLDTHASDDIYEVLTEVLNTNHPKKTYSYLEHKWRFQVASGASVELRVEAFRPDSEDGDDFTFEYSTDDVDYTPLLTVAGAVEQEYLSLLPANTSGTVYIRVVDTMRAWRTNSLDSVHIDYMVIETTSIQPLPPVVAFSGIPTSGYVPLTVEFTDESGNVPTAWIWDFGDGNDSTLQNPAHTYTATGVFSVTLTASNAHGSDLHTKVDYITVTEPTGDTMHVHDIVVTRKIAGPKNSGVADITIYDASELPVANATVFATATGPVGGNFSGLTDSDGTVHFETGKTRNPTGEWCFEVTEVTNATLLYNPAENDVTMACESGDAYKADGAANQLTSFTLDQNSPNPFNPMTVISFNLPREMTATLKVYNLRGQLIVTLADGSLAAGAHTVTWDARNNPSGVYFYRLTAGDITETRRMMLLK